MMEVIDLRDLADEYTDLQEREEDEDNPLDDSEKDRLEDLKFLDEQLYGDLETTANNEPTMILERDFKEYAEEVAIGVGNISESDPMFNYIDWDAWADDLRGDYTYVTFENSEYLVRSY